MKKYVIKSGPIQFLQQSNRSAWTKEAQDAILYSDRATAEAVCQVLGMFMSRTATPYVTEAPEPVWVIEMRLGGPSQFLNGLVAGELSWTELIGGALRFSDFKRAEKTMVGMRILFAPFATFEVRQVAPWSSEKAGL